MKRRLIRFRWLFFLCLSLLMLLATSYFDVTPRLEKSSSLGFKNVRPALLIDVIVVVLYSVLYFLEAYLNSFQFALTTRWIDDFFWNPANIWWYLTLQLISLLCFAYLIESNQEELHWTRCSWPLWICSTICVLRLLLSDLTLLTALIFSLPSFCYVLISFYSIPAGVTIVLMTMDSMLSVGWSLFLISWIVVPAIIGNFLTSVYYLTPILFEVIDGCTAFQKLRQRHSWFSIFVNVMIAFLLFIFGFIPLAVLVCAYLRVDIRLIEMNSWSILHSAFLVYNLTQLYFCFLFFRMAVKDYTQFKIPENLWF